MTKIRLFIVAALLASTVAGCLIHRARPCRTECWWSGGQRVCEKRCN